MRRAEGLARNTCFFFFSSRRRHTRFKCDWSSDVCSSDLWTRKSIPIGRRKEMTKPEARRKLRLLLDEMGVNKDASLLRASNLGETFQQKATRWENTDLIMCKPSSRNIPYIIKKHLILPFGDLPLDQITTDRVNECTPT